MGATIGVTAGLSAAAWAPSHEETVVTAADPEATRRNNARPPGTVLTSRMSDPCSVVMSGTRSMRDAARPTSPPGNHQCACTMSTGLERATDIAARSEEASIPAIATFPFHEPPTCALIVPVY